jgi:hypothetical protein
MHHQWDNQIRPKEKAHSSKSGKSHKSKKGKRTKVADDILPELTWEWSKEKKLALDFQLMTLFNENEVMSWAYSTALVYSHPTRR